MSSVTFFVGTKLEDLQIAAKGKRIIMIDGTVPGWKPEVDDLHWDHHRLGGAKIQIDEIPAIPIRDAHTSDWLIATTQLDADACVASAWVYCKVLNNYAFKDEQETIDKLRAIAYDCDHLCVPDELDYLADFAAKAVATFKVPVIRDQVPIEMGLDPAKSREWTDEQRLAVSAESFRRSTQWLIDAALGLRPFPGEMGEADGYQSKLESDAQMLIKEDRLQLINGVCVGDGTGKGYIDPRSFIIGWRCQFGIRETDWTLTYRDHKAGGIVYTIASKSQDLTDGVFDRLSAAEKAIDSTVDGWGGRALVGGSGWNTPSLLTIEQVVSIANA